MRICLIVAAILSSSCAGTCSSVGGGSLGYGSLGHGVIGGAQVVNATCEPFGSPDLAFMGCNFDGSNNTTLATNDPVCTWHDSGSLGVNATQGTGTACPTFVEGGGPNGTQDAVTFDGNDYLSTGAAAFASLAQPNMVAVVANIGSGAVVEAFSDGASSTTRHMTYSASGGPSMHAGGAVTSGLAYSLSTWHSTVATFDGASSTIRVDGASAGLSPGTQVPDGWVIGARFDGAATWFTGTIANSIVYDTVPVAADVEADLESHHASTFPVAP